MQPDRRPIAVATAPLTLTLIVGIAAATAVLVAVAIADTVPQGESGADQIDVTAGDEQAGVPVAQTCFPVAARVPCILFWASLRTVAEPKPHAPR